MPFHAECTQTAIYCKNEILKLNIQQILTLAATVSKLFEKYLTIFTSKKTTSQTAHIFQQRRHKTS